MIGEVEHTEKEVTKALEAEMVPEVEENENTENEVEKEVEAEIVTEEVEENEKRT